MCVYHVWAGNEQGMDGKRVGCGCGCGCHGWDACACVWCRPFPFPSLITPPPHTHTHRPPNKNNHHTTRTGKLENGLLVYVRPSLIRRSKHHFLTLPNTGVDVILGA